MGSIRHRQQSHVQWANGMRRFQDRSRFGCLLAAATIWPVLQAACADAQVVNGRSIGSASTLRLVAGTTPDFCATYGTGFVRLQGTNTCVRIGGHVRVGTTMDGSEQFEWGTSSFAAAPGGRDSAPSHVRLDSDFGAPGFR
jgi:hypothetical protein